MPGVWNVTVPIRELVIHIEELKAKGADRWKMRLFPTDKRLIEVRAWRFKARPDKRKRLKA